MTASGGLPPRRPDQRQLPTPRGAVPGARITRLGGTPGSQGTFGNGAQAPTAFFTFPSKSRIFNAGLTFTVGSNNTYAASVTPVYARVTTASGLVLCVVRLSVSAASQNANGGDRFAGPEAGVPVDKGDQLILDINNNVSLGTGGLMSAECAVFFSTP